ncbi:MAG: RNA polymerase sigma factor [Ignavibacteriaceae bacterium]
MSNIKMKNLTDLEIIESVKKGNHADFAILIDRYKNRAFSLLKRMLKNHFDAEEVLQDCFLKAFNALGTFRMESRFSTWFYRIVYNTAITKLSGKKRKIETEMSSIDDHIELRTEEEFLFSEQKDVSELLSKLVQKLPPNNASVINMFYIDGMSCEEISEVMSVSVSNVKVLLHRSRNYLKEMIIKNNYMEELL